MESSAFSVPEYLQALRERAKISLDALAQRMGYAGASSIQRYVDPRAYSGGFLRRDFVAKLAEALVGTGTPAIKPDDVWVLAGPEFADRPATKLYKTFDPDEPDEPFDERVNVAPRPDGDVPATPLFGKGDLIDEIDVRAGLGGGGLSIEEVTSTNGISFRSEAVRDHWRLPHSVLGRFNAHPNHIKAFQADGDSMEPTIRSGDIVFADTRHRVPSPPGVYVLSDQFGGVVVKRLEVISRPSDETINIRILSDNSRHAPQELTLDEVNIIGRYVGRFTA